MELNILNSFLQFIFSYAKKSILVFSFLFITATSSVLFHSTCYSGTVYYYLDSNGVFHFTDTPMSRIYRPYISPLKRIITENITTIHGYVEQFSRIHGVDASLVLAVIEVESGFNVNAVSRAGAQGLMQIMPNTQKELGLFSPFNPRDNIEAGVRYLKQQMDSFSDLDLALAAYNAGPGAVERYGGVPPFLETRNYVKNVMSIYNQKIGSMD